MPMIREVAVVKVGEKAATMTALLGLEEVFEGEAEGEALEEGGWDMHSNLQHVRTYG
jgi:hypothetical protein